MIDSEIRHQKSWIRQAILHLFNHKCWPVITCIPCEQLKDANNLFPEQYAQALAIYEKVKRERETEHGIQPG